MLHEVIWIAHVESWCNAVRRGGDVSLHLTQLPSLPGPEDCCTGPSWTTTPNCTTLPALSKRYLNLLPPSQSDFTRV